METIETKVRFGNAGCLHFSYKPKGQFLCLEITPPKSPCGARLMELNHIGNSYSLKFAPNSVEIKINKQPIFTSKISMFTIKLNSEMPAEEIIWAFKTMVRELGN